MKDALINNSRGFTIVEVVIVLAIAGLIFAVVFVAVPQLQQGQRDSARDSEFDRLESAITQYQSRNNGDLPGTGDVQHGGEVVDEYMNGEFADPIGGDFSQGSPDFENGEFSYTTGEDCDGNTGERYYAIEYAVEQGPDICRDNS